MQSPLQTVINSKCSNSKKDMFFFCVCHIYQKIGIQANDKNVDIFTEQIVKLKKRNSTERVFLRLWALWVKNSIIITPEEPNNKVKIFDATCQFVQDVFGEEIAKGMFTF